MSSERVYIVTEVDEEPEREMKNDKETKVSFRRVHSTRS